MGADHSTRTPRLFGSVEPYKVDDRNSTGVTSHSSTEYPVLAQPSGFARGPEQVRTAVGGFAGRCLTTRPPGRAAEHTGAPVDRERVREAVRSIEWFGKDDA